MAFRTHLNGEQRESIEKRRSHAIRQNADGVIALAGERQARGKKRTASISSISHASFPHADSACEKRNFTLKICFALARPSTRRSQPAANSNATSTVREQINKPCLFFSPTGQCTGIGVKEVGDDAPRRDARLCGNRRPQGKPASSSSEGATRFSVSRSGRTFSNPLNRLPVLSYPLFHCHCPTLP